MSDSEKQALEKMEIHLADISQRLHEILKEGSPRLMREVTEYYAQAILSDGSIGNCDIETFMRIAIACGYDVTISFAKREG